MKIKILSIGPYGKDRIGGVQYVTDMILSSYLTREFDFIILNTNIPSFFHQWRVFRPVLSLKFIALLIYQLVRYRPDVVHIHSSNVASFLEKGVMIFIARWFFGRRVLFHLHGSKLETVIQSRGWFRRFTRCVFRASHTMIVLSQSFRNILTDLVGQFRYVIIPHGVDLALYDRVQVAPRDDGLFVLSFIGLIGERKGCYELGEALDILVHQQGISNIRLEMVGREENPGELTAVQQFYRQKGVDAFVRFHGLKIGEEKIRILKQSDVFVLPSRHDSFGIVNLEAMAAGLPVISTRQGAIPEYLEENVNGFLIDIGDVSALVDRILRLYRDPALRQVMGRNNRNKIAERFSFPKVLKLYEQLYIQIARDTSDGRE